MNLNDRIKRRKRQADVSQLIQDYESLSPVAHIEEPPARGPVFEQLLDHLDPVFESHLPPNAYVYGPIGSGKSAVVVALFAHLTEHATGTDSIIHTSTRVDSMDYPDFVYLDVRQTGTEFAFYRTVLDALVEKSIPQHGISTEKLQARLHAVLDGDHPGAVIAVDHVDEPNSLSTARLVDCFAGLPSAVSWLAIGRADPTATSITEYTGAAIQIEPYQRQLLVDILMTRASSGLSQKAINHGLARHIADWADGNAHDGLCALFVAAETASQQDRTRLSENDVKTAVANLPQTSLSLGQVLVLAQNKQHVLRELVETDAAERDSIRDIAETIGARDDVDLSAGTIKRFLYELAETGVIERVPLEDTETKGRPPSRIKLQFSSTVFSRLYDLNH
jgi:Cdc6-like AAA superfamily ATPase